MPAMSVCHCAEVTLLLLSISAISCVTSWMADGPKVAIKVAIVAAPIII